MYRMNKVVLSIGSNSVDSMACMKKCVSWLSQLLEETKISSIYNTRAINGKDNDYLNAVIIGFTTHNYEDICNLMKQYEKDCGRTPESKTAGIVPIDIDVVIWNDCILRNKDYNQSYFQIGWNELDC